MVHRLRIDLVDELLKDSLVVEKISVRDSKIVICDLSVIVKFLLRLERLLWLRELLYRLN